MLRQYTPFLLLLPGSAIAQSLGPGESRTEMNALGQAITVTAADGFLITPPASTWPLADDEERGAGERHEVENERRSHPVVNMNALPHDGDPALQKSPAFRKHRSPIENFAGQNGSGTPPDPTGAAGPDHYVQAVNVSYRVYDKLGNAVAGPFNLSSLWPGSQDAGDPIVLYDRHADRWFISQFNFFPNRMLLAVSQTSDPTGSWYSYSFNFGSTFPDYPKFSIWWDGYYMTSNSSKTAIVFNRAKMLAGDMTAEMISLTAPSALNNGFTSVLPCEADGDLPPAGTPCYFFNLEDDNWGGVPVDRIKIYTMTTDWVTTSNTAVALSQTLPTDPFDTALGSGFDNIPQTGTTQKLDAVAEVFYFRAQHTRWLNHNSIVLCHVVDVGGNHAGMRWYELRDANDGVFAIHQQGTWSPDAAHRWMGSIAMDTEGNIGLAYSVSDVANGGYPSLRYTGRLAGDPPGQMTLVEETAQTGTAVQTSVNRFGDYAHMSLDPDGQTFWFTGEYIGTGGNPRTRIFSFDLGSPSGVEEAAAGRPSFTTRWNGSNIDVSVDGLPGGGALRFDVIGMDGRTLQQREAIPTGGAWRTSVDTRNMAAGAYFLRIGNASFQEVERIVVER